jgi:4,5-DOPA dioxygenase extradiol
LDGTFLFWDNASCTQQLGVEMTKPLPALFVGHGNPMNALSTNAYTAAWRQIGEDVPKPKTILSISAHWYVPFTGITMNDAPRTIHDFGGFPKELFQVQYPAPGNPELARRIQELLGPMEVKLDHAWGLDHGTWSVLCHVYPDADIPVIQLSIDETKAAAFHHEIGKKLSALRDEGVLIFGSGNLVHNLHTYAWGRHMLEPYDWASRFESRAKELILSNNYEPLAHYETLGPDAELAVPTPEHYLPLLYVLGARREGDAIAFPVQGVDGGSISMLALQIG